MNKPWLIRLSFALNILTALIAATVVLMIWLNPAAFINGFLLPMQERRLSFFEAYAVNPSAVVFLGDSITEGGEWNELFPRVSTVNRGISGDTTAGVLDRLEQITEVKPAAVFLKIGTNDLSFGPADRNLAYLQYREIVTRIRTESPETDLYLQSLLPRGADVRADVENYNDYIEELAQELELPYIDLYPHFLAADGSIRDELSNDELHLGGAGYQLWQQLLTPYMKKY